MQLQLLEYSVYIGSAFGVANAYICRGAWCGVSRWRHDARLDSAICSDSMARGSRLGKAVCRVFVGSRSCLRAVWLVPGWFRSRSGGYCAAKPKVRSSWKRGRGGDENAEGRARQGPDNWHGILLADFAPEQLEEATKLARALPHYDRFICKRRPDLMWRRSQCRQPKHACSNARFVSAWSEDYVRLLIDMAYVWVHSLGFLDLTKMQDEVSGYLHGNWGERSLVQGPLLQLQTAATPEPPFPVSMNANAQHLQAHHPLYQCLVPMYQQPRAGDRVMIPPAAWTHIIRCQCNCNPLARTHEGLDLDTVLIAKLK